MEFTYPQGLKKALTFSYDDGREFDRRLVEIFNQHGLKGTFHLNSGTLGLHAPNGDFVAPGEVKELYQGHEVAVHTVSHLHPMSSPLSQVSREIAEDRKALEALTGGLVVGTGDLSELALGWATYNGDHMSMYGVNAGVPKTLVRHLVRYEADIAATPALKEVLLDILDTPVSPELLPAKDNGEIAQRTEDLVGPYELHDFYLYYVLRFGFGPAKIFRLARAAFAGREEYPDAVLYKWLRNFYWRFFAQQFKRSCLPDGPKIGSVTLSPRGDWRMPSDACAALWLAELEQLFPQKDA